MQTLVTFALEGSTVPPRRPGGHHRRRTAAPRVRRDIHAGRMAAPHGHRRLRRAVIPCPGVNAVHRKCLHRPGPHPARRQRGEPRA
ncbi:hypothetical protein LV779_22060 [Streptomyces thinghirensis]|nr:hypothetical protein [Streptomyces thinghirensis]